MGQKVIVIGGGAAGMMAAIRAADCGGEVTLIEKNEKIGKKLFITGKGRCNLTNAAEMDAFMSNVCTNPKFLYRAFDALDNKSLMKFVENAGCRLKIERGGRVFPQSDHSSDVIAAFTRELKKRKVNLLLNTTVEDIITDELLYDSESEMQKQAENIDSDNRNKKKQRRFQSICKGVKLADGKELFCDKCIVCTGGVSYPATGSTGDGYRFAEQSGHRIVSPQPSLVPFETEEKWCAELMGLSLKNVSVKMCCGKKELYSGFGEMLFTHFGVSGPLILSASAWYGKRKGDEVKLFLDLKPALFAEQLDKRILKDFEKNKNKCFKNSLAELFPAKMIPVMTRLSGIDPEKKVNEISRMERQNFVKLIKMLPLTVTKTRSFQEAIITQGGVSVKDVNPASMESRLVKNLYFAGEVLDLDALTGGFNLQIAWSTGYLAGSNLA